MEKEKRELRGARELRRKAEERLKLKPAVPEKLSELETQELIEELRVHQIELEMQNEEVRRTQAVLEESRAKYSDLYDFAPVGYLTLNRQGLILEANLTACSKLGEERSLLINIKNLFTNFIIKKGGKDLFYQHLGKVFEAKSLETCELELKGKGDTKFYAQLQSIVVKDNLSQCRTALTDITERKKADETLRETNAYLDNLFNYANAPIIVWSPQFKITRFNHAFELLTGRSAGEVLGQTLDLLFPPARVQLTMEFIRKTLMGERWQTVEIEILHRDGTIRTVLWNSATIFDSGGKNPIAIIAQGYDITERKKAERELRVNEETLKKANEELQKLNQVKSDFISTVSHELRTPLTTMKEFTSILLDGIPGKINKEQKEYLNIVRGNISRLARIIANLLDISKIEAKKMELKRTLVNIKTLVEDVVSGLKSRADAKHIAMKILFPRVLSDVYIDSDRITQIFTNLIDNAIKFTPEKGKIVVEIKAGEKEMECSVSDTGVGIAPENRDKVFEKFTQIDRMPDPGTRGTGLGLAIIKDLVQLHNGKIWVESELDKGSKFIFTLPKIKVEEIFKEYITNGLKEAADRKSSLSLIVVHIIEFSQLQEKWGEKPLYLLTDIERVVKDSLRRRADTVLRTTGELIIPLSDTRKEDAEVVKKRIEEAIRTYLAQCKEEWIKEIRITVGSATYPDEANNHQELLDKAKAGGIKI